MTIVELRGAPGIARALAAFILAASAPAARAAEPAPAAPDAGERRFVKDGVAIEFSVKRADESRPIREGDFVEVQFAIRDAATGQPLRGTPPGAWLDVGATGPAAEQKSCKEKIPLYMRGLVGIRPLVDLNSYYLLVLNQDPSISVVDPVVGMTGKTSLFTSILLKKPGADWVRDRGDKRVFVSMPRAGQVAVVDGERFEVRANVDAGKNPTRVALQPDGRYLWVGNDTMDAADGVTVIDTQSLARVRSIPTGKGHHEIAFSTDDRLAFVTNRASGTVSVIDVATLKKVKDHDAGPVPISIATSRHSQAIYVADAKTGRITVLDGRTGEPTARLAAKPGLGPMRFSEDGRWGLVVNPAEQVVHVVDAAEGRLAHAIAIGGQPFQVAFTRGYAYVRLLDSEHVRMIALSSLEKGERPRVQKFPAGAVAPKLARDLSIADGFVASAGDAGMFVVSPGDNSTYFYMEGMNAPMGSYKGYGHSVRAVSLVDRSLRETEPGVYSSTVRVPAPGKYDVAVILDSPRVLHCFAMDAEPDLAAREKLGAVDVEFLEPPSIARVGTPVPLRFRLLEPATHAVRTGLAPTLRTYRVPGHDRARFAAREVEPGIYEASPTFRNAGAHYVHVEIASLGVDAGELPYLALAVQEPAKTASTVDAGGLE